MIDRHATLLPRFEGGKAIYGELPLFKQCGVDTKYLERDLDEPAIYLHGHLLPPVDLCVHELEIAQELSPESHKVITLLVQKFFSTFEGVDQATGCWTRHMARPQHTPRGEDSQHRPGAMRANYPGFGSQQAHNFGFRNYYGVYTRATTVHRDHLCSNHSCAGPRHLEQVSSKVNTQRARNRCEEGMPDIFGLVRTSMPQPIALGEVKDMYQHLLSLHDDGL